MRIGIQIPDEWGRDLDAAAKKDGHSNRSAVIRKAVQAFLFDNTGGKPKDTVSAEGKKAETETAQE